MRLWSSMRCADTRSLRPGSRGCDRRGRGGQGDDPRQALDIEVDEVARPFVLVAHYRRRRIERTQPVHAGAAQDAADRGPGSEPAPGRSASRCSATGEEPKCFLSEEKRWRGEIGADAKFDRSVRQVPTHDSGAPTWPPSSD
jgi:hypothetical protein